MEKVLSRCLIDEVVILGRVYRTVLWLHLNLKTKALKVDYIYLSYVNCRIIFLLFS
jgi:hypothetical protein